MTRYDKEGLTTDEPLIAAMFLGAVVGYYDGLLRRWHIGELTHITSVCCTVINKDGHTRYPMRIRVPWALVGEAIKPVEGEASFEFWETWHKYNMPDYYHEATSLSNTHDSDGWHYVVRATPLTLGKTNGELSDLIERIVEGQR